MTPPLRVSVALCTYNGSRYLPPQWETICRQTELPWEVVVCDDGSSDHTASLLEQYAREERFTVRVIRNPGNLGSTANFAQAIEACRGDVIVLADQDDRWRSDKLAAIQQVFQNAPETELIFTDAALIDADGAATGERLWDCIGFSPRFRRMVDHGRLFDVLLKRYVMTGATMAFRTHLRADILPIPAIWVHDAWIALVAAMTNRGVKMLGEPLIEYRRHPGQQIGAVRRTYWQQYLHARTLARQDLERLQAQFQMAEVRAEELLGRDHARVEQLQSKIRHLAARVSLRESGRFHRTWIACREFYTGRYDRYSLGWKTCLVDLLT